MASEFVPSARRFSSIDGLRPLQANIIYGCPAHNLYVEVVHVIVCGRIMPGLSGSEAVHCAARVIHVVDSAWSVQTIQRPNGGPALSHYWVCIVFLGVQSSPWRSLTPVITLPRTHCQSSKHDTLGHCWAGVEPSSATLAQHQPSIGPMYRVCWESRWFENMKQRWANRPIRKVGPTFIHRRVRGPPFNFPGGPGAAGVFFKWIFWDWILMK